MHNSRWLCFLARSCSIRTHVSGLSSGAIFRGGLNGIGAADCRLGSSGFSLSSRLCTRRVSSSALGLRVKMTFPIIAYIMFNTQSQLWFRQFREASASVASERSDKNSSAFVNNNTHPTSSASSCFSRLLFRAHACLYIREQLSD